MYVANAGTAQSHVLDVILRFGPPKERCHTHTHTHKQKAPSSGSTTHKVARRDRQRDATGCILRNTQWSQSCRQPGPTPPHLERQDVEKHVQNANDEGGPHKPGIVVDDHFLAGTKGSSGGNDSMDDAQRRRQGGYHLQAQPHSQQHETMPPRTFIPSMSESPMVP